MNRSFYKYEFVSAAPIYARIKEELRSYFSTGAIDDLLFPTWTDDCMRKLGRLTYPIDSDVINIDTYTAKLPDNFFSAREIWACERIKDVKYQSPSAIYTQLSTKIYDSETEVNNPNARCNTSCEFPDEMTVIYKTKDQRIYHYHKQWLLHPGNINVKSYCSEDCFNMNRGHEGFAHNHHNDTFDIHGNKLVTSFREGHVFVLYYATPENDEGERLIPDNYRIEKFLEAYIKYKLFEQIFNQTTDETYNQVERKLKIYQEAHDEAFVLADIDSKKKTMSQKIDSINNTKRRNRDYIIT